VLDDPPEAVAHQQKQQKEALETCCDISLARSQALADLFVCVCALLVTTHSKNKKLMKGKKGGKKKMYVLATWLLPCSRQYIY